MATDRFTQVALAVHAARFNSPYGSRAPTPPDSGDWEYACRLTKAALEALKGGMSEAMYDALPATGKVWPDLNSTEVWNALLEAVLKEGVASSGRLWQPE